MVFDGACFASARTSVRFLSVAASVGNGIVQVQCFFTSTSTIRTVRDGEPMTSTSNFTQLLSSDTADELVECCFTSTETVGLLSGTGAQDGHLDFHTAREL